MDTGWSVEKKRELNTVRLGGSHGAVVSLSVKLLDFIFLCK